MDFAKQKSLKTIFRMAPHFHFIQLTIDCHIVVGLIGLRLDIQGGKKIITISIKTLKPRISQIGETRHVDVSYYFCLEHEQL